MTSLERVTAVASRGLRIVLNAQPAVNLALVHNRVPLILDRTKVARHSEYFDNVKLL